MWQIIEDNVSGILYILLYPSTMKVARINVGAWFFALVFALTSIGLFVSNGAWTSPMLWFNIGIGAIDVYLLRRSWLGYRWRSRVRARRRAESI